MFLELVGGEAREFLPRWSPERRSAVPDGDLGGSGRSACGFEGYFGKKSGRT